MVPTGILRAQELVSVPTTDGGVVFADVYGDGVHGVVLAHGGRFTKESWSEQAKALADSGFRVVAINFRGRGQSRAGTAGQNGAPYDVLAAAEYLRGQGAREVSVVGASFGGWAAARAAITAPEAVDRLVLLAASPVEEPLTVPTLFIVSREDAMGSGTLRLPGIRAQYEAARGPKKLVVLDGSAHAQFLFETDQARRLWSAITGFLARPTP